MVQQLTALAFDVFRCDGTCLQAAATGDVNAAAGYLEEGSIIYFPESPFKRSAADRQLLLSQHQKDASYHKNIAYRPLENKVTGLGKTDKAQAEQLRAVMADFSRQAVALVEQLFPAYKTGYKLDFASFRPLEEQGRKMRLRARNDLLHVDSFPTRPIFGDRIMRVFENVSLDRMRVWRTSENFEVLVDMFKHRRKPPGNLDSPPHTVPALLKALGMKANAGSPYDKWMLDFHNFLKENSRFQADCRKNLWQFPPGSAWIVYTDQVSHSVLSGQYALEQTFIISKHRMVKPQYAPINVLKQAYGQGGN